MQEPTSEGGCGHVCIKFACKHKVAGCYNLLTTSVGGYI